MVDVEKLDLAPEDNRQWHAVLRNCVQLLAVTGCVVAVLLAMAQDPSWDELQKGIPASLIASAAAWLAGRFLPK